jgi:hypothetical protein
LVHLRKLRDQDAVYIDLVAGENTLTEITLSAAICIRQLVNQLNCPIGDPTLIENGYSVIPSQLNTLIEAAEEFLSSFGEFDLKTGKSFLRSDPEET